MVGLKFWNAMRKNWGSQRKKKKELTSANLDVRTLHILYWKRGVTKKNPTTLRKLVVNRFNSSHTLPTGNRAPNTCYAHVGHFFLIFYIY
jgi:hypothetical protein